MVPTQHIRYFVKILTQCLHQLRRGPRNRRVVLELSETDSKHIQTLKKHPTIESLTVKSIMSTTLYCEDLDKCALNLFLIP